MPILKAANVLKQPCEQILFRNGLTSHTQKQSVFIIIILFIVQCWTQASKPEPLKQDTQKEKNKINLYSKL